MTDPIRPHRDGAIDIDVQVAPRASRDRIAGQHGDRVKLQIQAPPVDGAANAAVTDLLARTLGVGKRDVAIVRGQTGKRKTVRIFGISIDAARARLGLALCLLGASGPACTAQTTGVEVQLVLPADQSDLSAVNNVTITLAPDGFVDTFATTGLDFAFEAEIDPDDTPRELAAFLARDDALLAWGRTPRFTFSAGATGVALLTARPGTISTFPGVLDAPDPNTLAAYARGAGLVAVRPDGTTFFMSELTLIVQGATPLDASVGLPPEGDGALLSDGFGGVVRLGWEQGLSAARFDPGDNSWIPLPLSGADLVGPRPAAAVWADAAGERALLIGGEGSTEVVSVDLVPRGGTAFAAVVEGLQLDVPRPPLTTAFVARDGTDDEETVLVFGSDDANVPVVYALSNALGLGPGGPWIGARCIQLDRGGAGVDLRVVCAGGTRDDMPTGDGLLLTLGPQPSATELPDLLSTPVADPLWFDDEGAVYAQGADRLFRLNRADLVVTEVTAAALRTAGGASVTVSTGATFLVGGTDADDAPVDRLQVFMPNPGP